MPIKFNKKEILTIIGAINGFMGIYKFTSVFGLVALICGI